MDKLVQDAAQPPSTESKEPYHLCTFCQPFLHPQDSIDMFHGQLRLLVCSKQSSCLDNILYLPSVELFVSQMLQFKFWENAGKRVPDMEPALIVQVGVVDCEMDSWLERWVKSWNSIGCQEHDSLVVFKEPKEDRNEFISMHVWQRTAFEKHVTFVESSRTRSRSFSTSCAMMPNSPALMLYRGFLMASATIRAKDQ